MPQSIQRKMQETDHLAMNCGRGFELRITEKLVVRAGLKLGDNAATR